MKKLLGFVFMLSLFGFSVITHAQTPAEEPVVTPISAPAPIMDGDANVQGEKNGKVMWDKWQDKEMRGGHKMGSHFVHVGGSSLNTLWVIGWLFTIGYLGLTFWKGVLALIIWPYYIGKNFKKAEVVKS